MSDTEGNRPDPASAEADATNETPSVPVADAATTPAPAHPDPSATAPTEAIVAPSAPDTAARPAAQAWSAAETAVYPVAQTPAPAAPQATTAAPQAPAIPPAAYVPQAPSAAHGVPPRPPYPAAYPTPPKQQYAGAPAGQAFGPAATAPTLPLSGSTKPGTAPARKKSSAGKVVGLLVAAALVGGAAGLGGTYAGMSLWGASTTASAVSPSVVTVNDTDNVNAITGVAAKALPSVVTISASSGSAGGTGSGVIISDDGYVLTNTHVVTLDGATSDPAITVTTSDGKVYSATVVGTDPTYDLAVIQLEDASGLTPIEFADSSDLNVGDVAIALGAPLGLDNTVTTGIVSALNRSIEIASSAAPEDASGDATEEGDGGEQGGQESPFQFDFGQGDSSQQATSTIKISVIQTDAAINPGNSGGALVDDEGNLIGINVAIASSGSSTSGQSGNIGVGFSIPSNVAERVANEIIETGAATHGLLGATVQDAATQQGATIEGALIAEVSAGGAADEGGLRSGDIVTGFEGAPVGDAIDLTALVRAQPAGADATVTYVRDGAIYTTDVTLGTLE